MRRKFIILLDELKMLMRGIASCNLGGGDIGNQNSDSGWAVWSSLLSWEVPITLCFTCLDAPIPELGNHYVPMRQHSATV